MFDDFVGKFADFCRNQKLIPKKKKNDVINESLHFRHTDTSLNSAH